MWLSFLYFKGKILLQSVACAGLISAGAEKKFRGSRSAKFFSAPPLAEFDSAPWVEKTRKGAENLIIPRERGRNNLTI
jgi:hypothetical protein